jgi:hypothetical protein
MRGHHRKTVWSSGQLRMQENTIPDRRVTWCPLIRGRGGPTENGTGSAEDKRLRLDGWGRARGSVPLREDGCASGVSSALAWRLRGHHQKTVWSSGQLRMQENTIPDCRVTWCPLIRGRGGPAGNGTGSAEDKRLRLDGWARARGSVPYGRMAVHQVCHPHWHGDYGDTIRSRFGTTTACVSSGAPSRTACHMVSPHSGAGRSHREQGRVCGRQAPPP